MTPPSEQNARLRPFTCFNWKSFLLDELIIIHPPLSVLLYQLDIEAQDQLLDELVQFHEGYVLAQTRARAAATALVSFESFVKKFVNHMRILSSSTQQIRIFVITHLQVEDLQTEMALCMWCMWNANVPAHLEFPHEVSHPHIFDCKQPMKSAEAHRSVCKETRNLYCEDCDLVFSTPAESTEHAQSHRRHFCFVCGIEARLPGRKLPGQHCRVVGHDPNSVKANAKTPQTASPQIKIKKFLGHRQSSYTSPYSTQRRNIQAEKDLCIGYLLKWPGGLTVGQRATIDIKPARSGQVVDYLSDRDLLRLALTIRSEVA